MYFKSLEIAGFKSFADKTRFDFEPGVTAIVGPNGCGKSNIADAIRWVLGEQNARLLRGTRMEDVIFNGSELRKPVGFSEVSLTLTGVDRVLSVDYSEITVTRRVFRSGEGQYLINKTPCRLKDIEELFMGTGIGLSAYSIIEQGKMDMVLSSKPEDRRFIFEEAAGITKYKEKKREALRKLESTEANLLRLTDIIKEVRRQLSSVERQAGRARRAKEVGDELRRLELQVGARRLSDIDARLRAAEGSREEARRREEEATRRLKSLEAENEALRDRLRALDGEIGTVQAKRMGVAGTIENNRTRIEAHEKLIRELEEGGALYRAESDALEETVRRLRAEEAALDDALEAAAQEHRCAAEALKAAEIELARARGGMADLEARAEREREEAVEIANRASRRRNELASLRFASRSDALRFTRLGVEARELEEKIGRAKIENEGRRRRREQAEELRNAASSVLANAREALRGAQRGDAAAREELRSVEARLSRCEAEIALLERYRDACVGCPDGARVVVNEARREGSRLSGVLGVVMEKLQPLPGYERAIEAALGSALQAVLTRTREDARAAIAFLENGAGASFLPVEEVDRAPLIEWPGGPAAAAPLRSCVAVEEGFAAAADYLLGGAYFVETLGDALAMLSGCRSGMRLATRAGELIVAGGGMGTIGRAREASPFVTRESELVRARGEKEALSKQRGEILGRITEGEAARDGADGGCAAAEDRMRGSEIDLAAARTEELRGMTSLEHLEGELAAVRGEVEEIETRRAESAAGEREIEEAIAADERREKEIQDALAALRAGQESKAGEIASLQQAFTGHASRAAAAGEKETGLRANRERAARDAGAAAGALKSRRDQRERADARRAALAAEVESLRAAIVSLIAERDSTELDAQESEKRRQALYARQKEVDGLLREGVAALGKIKDEAGRCDVLLAEQRAERKGLVERIREQYGEDLAAAVPDPAPVNWEEAALRIEELREKLRRIGPVNMVALEEHQELESRLKFLTEQEADLLAAKDSLVKAIHRINTETKRMFSETFEAIRTNFKQTYRELFEGGSADLLLEEGVDILEAGINIVSRPEGKRLQSITLLSGGEKALTAVALLFALFKVKPSPFCVLDEIDAPLDESNINRFLKLLGSFLSKSQFIIVTHNKRTIGMADVMYGITMEESGVSKVVSVKFKKHQEVPGAAASR